jgi:hypothetical protein
MKTIIYQSFRRSNVPAWVETCIGSVRAWAEMRKFSYRFFDDEIFDRVPFWVLEKTGEYRQTATDLGRLILAQELLREGYDRVVWIDADVLIFSPIGFTVETDQGFAFGRESWVQPNANGGIKVYKNVHNAISVFCKGNSFLEFYIHSSLNILKRADGPLVPQIIGPKFLTALHNIIGFNLIEDVGMASPLVIDDLANGGGVAWDLLEKTNPVHVSALNLCTSLVEKDVNGVHVSDSLVEQAVSTLLDIRRTV